MIADSLCPKTRTVHLSNLLIDRAGFGCGQQSGSDFLLETQTMAISGHNYCTRQPSATFWWNATIELTLSHKLHPALEHKDLMVQYTKFCWPLTLSR